VWGNLCVFDGWETSLFDSRALSSGNLVDGHGSEGQTSGNCSNFQSLVWERTAIVRPCEVLAAFEIFHYIRGGGVGDIMCLCIVTPLYRPPVLSQRVRNRLRAVRIRSLVAEKSFLDIVLAPRLSAWRVERGSENPVSWRVGAACRSPSVLRVACVGTSRQKHRRGRWCLGTWG